MAIVDKAGAANAVVVHPDRTVLKGAGRAQPPRARRLSPGSLLDSVFSRSAHPRVVILEILPRFRVAQQENFVLRVVTAGGSVFAVSLPLAVIHARGNNALLFTARKRLVQECSIQPRTQAALLPC